MKGINIFLIFLLLTNFIFGQVVPNDYSIYYSKVINIKDVIANEELKEAEQMYIKLFNDYKPPFVSEVLIAAQLSAFNKNYQNTVLFLEKALKKGVRKGCVLRLPAFNEFVKSTYWKKLLDNYQSYRTFYYHSIDSVLLIQFCEMLRYEQENKQAVNALSIIESNYQLIKRVINLKGHFPGERMVGTPEPDLPNRSDCSLGSVLIPTLLHYEFSFSSLEKELERALKEGYLHPREFANIYTFQKWNESDGYPEWGSKYLNFEKPALPDYKFDFAFFKRWPDKERVNADRSKFGICSIQTQEKLFELEEKYDFKLIFFPY